MRTTRFVTVDGDPDSKSDIRILLIDTLHVVHGACVVFPLSSCSGKSGIRSIIQNDIGHPICPAASLKRTL